jgi:hypothetical protein
MTGWICPKCGKVLAPHVQGCDACNSQMPLQPNVPWTPYTPAPTYPWHPLPGPGDPPYRWEVTSTTAGNEPYCGVAIGSDGQPIRVLK